MTNENPSPTPTGTPPNSNDALREKLLATGWTKSFEAIALEIKRVFTAAKVTYEALKPGLEAVADVALTIAKVLPDLLEKLPPNIRSLADKMDLERILDLATTEGIQFAYVPPTPVILKILNANSKTARRKVIGNNHRTILASCEEELTLVHRDDLHQYVTFAKSAAAALRQGHRDASQALSANLMDTILADQLRSLKKVITDQKKTPDVDEYSIRAAITLLAVWSAHGQFFPGKGDKVPRQYSRHGTVHGVSRRQFTVVNATLALIHVVALLRLLESQPEI